ncbi:SDR family NAD(P)-dependent oxidoreductase [Nocardia sp. NPDC051321]|uniref:SDR family NAD(P)-dependent oxidoreductase n=1 Tax=Nocardia sp. NPDC051321 TaxID=3364323 RepID=UPI0037BD19E8
MQDFTGRTVVVTGGNGGMGASHVRGFHAAGANVIIAGRNADAGYAFAAELGDRARYVALDVTDEQQWHAAITTAEAAFGPVSVLVNNAGIQNPAATLEDTDRQNWERVLAVNLTGTYLGIKAAAPSLRRAGGGAVVNIGSAMGHGGTAMFGPYVASKWAVRGLTATAALELARDNVRVNAVDPGVVSTPFIHEPTAPGQAAIADHFSPEPLAVPRLADPAEITKLVLFLASDDASFATGQDYVVDGGLLLGPALPAAS